MGEALYRWRVYDVTSPWKKKGGWRVLTWDMTEANTAQWAKANGFGKVEKVEGSEKQYTYVGHGAGRSRL